MDKYADSAISFGGVYASAFAIEQLTKKPVGGFWVKGVDPKLQLAGVSALVDAFGKEWATSITSYVPFIKSQPVDVQLDFFKFLVIAVGDLSMAMGSGRGGSKMLMDYLTGVGARNLGALYAASTFTPELKKFLGY